MHYAAIVGEDQREIEVIEVSPGHFRITMLERVLEIDARTISENTMSLLIGGQAYDVGIEHDPTGGGNLLVRGNVVHVEVLDLRRARLRQAQHASGAATGPANIASPMPGKVVAILVEEGQEVQAGDGLVVVEAMKMENELRAPRAGIVRGLNAREGVAVDGGVTLCVVE